METAVITIAGMSCQRCVESVRAALSALAGVTQIDVTLDRGEARVTFDPQSTSVDRLKAAIADAGFELR